MATIVSPQTGQPAPVNNMGVTMDGIFNFFLNPVVLFIFAFIILIIVIVVFVVMKQKKEDSLKERDNINYALYKSTMRSCLHNSNPKWINKTYSLKNILFLGIPIFWNEHSLKVVDQNDVLMGYYRGHKTTPKGETIYCLYKTKRFLILENLILLRTINSHNYENKVELIDDKTKKSTGKFKTDYKEIEFSNFYEWLPKNVNQSLYTTLKIQCDGINEDGSSYFYIPDYIRNDGTGKVFSMDLTPEFRKNQLDYTANEQLWRTITDLSRNIDESARSNPHVALDRHKIEKTDEEVRRDAQTPQSKERSL